MFTGAVFYKAVEEGNLFAYNLGRSMHGTLHASLYYSTQVPGVPEAIPFATAIVLLGTVLVINAFSIAFRIYLRSRKRW